MIIKVQNETPFQVLTGAFSIGPSETGYELQVGATPQDFATLFSVGANTTRMVTNVANGSYYRLKNNVGEVKVNWSRTCVTNGGGSGSGTELQPVTEFPLGAAEGTVVALASGDTYGIYQYDGENWNEAGADIDLSAYWTSAETQSAITIVEDHLFDFEEVTSSALTELHEGLLEVSGRTISTEEIELPIAAAVNDLKGNIETRLNQQYYKKAEVNDIAARKVEAAQVDEKIKDYVDPAIAEVNDNIEDKELATSAALNDLNTATVKSTVVKNIWSGTQSEYDAIVEKDQATLYIIKD